MFMTVWSDCLGTCLGAGNGLGTCMSGKCGVCTRGELYDFPTGRAEYFTRL